MFDEMTICPYTGLRSFTEEESLYFKGRDTHIQQATEMLQEKKFLMLTGASGDGKSSLVYAGIIPNARAGFLKATYSNWRVADFRPERSPFDNMCSAIAGALDIKSVETVKSELQHGFSALADLYRSSDLYVDQNTEDWQNASDHERSLLNRKTANLIILADQFEEFFSNPENYIRGVPSNASYLTVNLLLETARIAIDENLPIYVVFTMRSDYIGQCAAFRGLPEYIGFSQFFVPRLNRKEMQEVIEEPAELSGNRISRRLTERLIHDVRDGVDQLPILQHALNQIWKAASDGQEEMDLIHYAMVGGLSPDELPEEDQQRFNDWFAELPQSLRNCYKEPSLQRVLDTHANKNYASGSYYYQLHTERTIDDDLAHLIIKTSFVCLTKIDHSRAVRNRMTLEEITEIINHPEIDQHKVNEVINVFREPGNTFIRPFIEEDKPETRKLEPGVVLDITHESLIRNWEMLKEWADEEFDKFNTFADFKQQVDRWLEHDRSWGFLLPVGSLTYFEEWFEEVDPNEHWVNRYNEQVTDTPKDLRESAEIVNASKHFLNRSATKHLVTRTMVRLGPKRLVAMISVLLLLSLTSFTYYNHLIRTEEHILSRLNEEAISILNEGHARPSEKAFYVINRDRIAPGQFFEVLEQVDSIWLRFETALHVAVDLALYDRKSNKPLKKQSILYAEELANKMAPSFSNFSQKDGLLNGLLNLAEVMEYHLYHFDDDQIQEALDRQIRHLSEIILWVLDNPWPDMNIQKLNEGIEMVLNHKGFTTTQIREVIERLESENGKMSTYYQRDKRARLDWDTNLTYNGKYQVLAELYASLGLVEESLLAVDVIMEDHEDYAEFSTDDNTVAGYFALYGHWDALDAYARALAKRKEINLYEVYRQILDRCGFPDLTLKWRFSRANEGGFTFGDYWGNPILEYLPEQQIELLYERYLESINGHSLSADERNFAQAIYYKQRGILTTKILENKSFAVPRERIYEFFDKSLENYREISRRYLDEEIQANFHTQELLPRREVFIYPDYRAIVNPHTKGSWNTNYFTPFFLEYVIDSDLLNEMYPKTNELETIQLWLKAYEWRIRGIRFRDANEIPPTTFEKIALALEAHPEATNQNLTRFWIMLARDLSDAGNTDDAFEYLKKINTVALTGVFTGFGPNYLFQDLVELLGVLEVHGEHQLVSKLLDAVPGDPQNKSTIMDYLAQRYFLTGDQEKGMKFLKKSDSVIANTIERRLPWGKIHNAYATSLKKEPEAIEEARDKVRNLWVWGRTLASGLIVRGGVYQGNYFEAATVIPKFPSSEERLMRTNQFLYAYSFYANDPEWVEYDRRKDRNISRIPFFD